MGTFYLPQALHNFFIVIHFYLFQINHHTKKYGRYIHSEVLVF